MKAITLDEHLDSRLGIKGTERRDEFEKTVEEEIHAYHLGEAIRQARKERSLTQEQLGNMIGVQKAQISRIEKGRNITINSLARILKALEISANLELCGIGKVALW